MTSQVRGKKWYGGRSARATSDRTKAASWGGAMLTVACGVSILFSSTSQAAGECTLQLRPTDGIPGVSGTIQAMTRWDPDGDGPEPELLVVGGNFSFAGTTRVENVAAWDGKAWRPVGTNPLLFVFALEIYNGELIAAGWSQPSLSDAAVVRWDGNEWQPLGLGLNGNVGHLIVFNDELIASGGFTTAGGVAARYIARWNGTEWQPLDGSDNNAYGGPMAVLNGELLALGPGGSSGSYQVSKWNGVEWSLMTSVIHGYELNDLKIMNGELYAAGWFSAPDGKSTRSLARWTGADWELLGEELFGAGLSLQVFGGELHLGGSFPYFDEEHSDYFFYARWGPDCAPGDMNCDGVIDLSDVPIFVAAMLEPEGESDCVRYLANLTGDVTAEGASKVDSTDIAAFVAALLQESTGNGRQPPDVFVNVADSEALP